MNSTFLDAAENRRTRYALSSESHISDERIREILETAIKHSPSAFNSQTSRVVLLKGAEHHELWNIVLESLKAISPPEVFESAKAKVAGFDAAYATILFFEEQDTVSSLQKQFPIYAQSFPSWSEQGSGMLQFVVWTALENEGLGVNLQHYNPLIDEKVREKWDFPKSWKLMSQMPFGVPTAPAGEKEFMPIKERLKIIG